MYFQSTQAFLGLVSCAPGMEVGVRTGRQTGDICVEGSCREERSMNCGQVFKSCLEVFSGCIGDC